MALYHNRKVINTVTLAIWLQPNPQNHNSKYENPQISESLMSKIPKVQNLKYNSKQANLNIFWREGYSLPTKHTKVPGSTPILKNEKEQNIAPKQTRKAS